jgi:hypothetical protein
MNEYKIERWDVILENNHRVPIIYIKPDLAFVEFVRKNENVIIIKIKNTNTIYDNKKIVGKVNLSSNVINCRPNFFAYTGYYVITLDSSWNGYPKSNNLGSILLQ